MTTQYADQAYQEIAVGENKLPHAYGDQVRILADTVSLTLLAELCKEETTQPAINELVRELYRPLLCAVINDLFPRSSESVVTRMHAFTPRGVWNGSVVARETRAVAVNIMRAGALPSQVCFDYLNRLLEPSGVRQDHVVMSRTTDDKERVTGAHFGDSKIGGDIDDRIVLFPDPMGATGGSISTAIQHYKDQVAGAAKQMVAMNLIVTPEYLKRMQTDHPDVYVYAHRIDRGMSDDDVLQATPGKYWERESGLNDKQYIVPGGGGFGEIINNAYCD